MDGCQRCLRARGVMKPMPRDVAVIQKRAYASEPSFLLRISRSERPDLMSVYTFERTLGYRESLNKAMKPVLGLVQYLVTQIGFTLKFVRIKLMMKELQYSDLTELVQNLLGLAYCLPVELQCVFPNKQEASSRMASILDSYGASPRLLMIRFLLDLLPLIRPLMRHIGGFSMIGRCSTDVNILTSAAAAARCSVPFDPVSKNDRQLREEAVAIGGFLRSSELKELIGQGAYGTVYVAENGNFKMYLKLVSQASAPLSFVSAILASEMTSPFISPYYGAAMCHLSMNPFAGEKPDHYLIMPYTGSIDLYTYIACVRDANAINEFNSNLRIITAQVVLAYHTLHRLGLTHSDIKPQNLVIDVKGKVMIIDTDCCSIILGSFVGPIVEPVSDVVRRLQNLEARGKVLVTRSTAAPETRFLYNSPMGDWFSVGATLHQLFHHFCGENTFLHYMGKIPENKYGQKISLTYDDFRDMFTSEGGVKWSCGKYTFVGLREFKELVNSLLSIDPRKRPRGFEDIRRMEYFRKLDFAKLYEHAHARKCLLFFTQILESRIGQKKPEAVDPKPRVVSGKCVCSYVSRSFATTLQGHRRDPVNSLGDLDIARTLGVSFTSTKTSF